MIKKLMTLTSRLPSVVLKYCPRVTTPSCPEKAWLSTFSRSMVVTEEGSPLVERMSVSCEEVTVEAGWERISNPVSVSAAPSDI